MISFGIHLVAKKLKTKTTLVLSGGAFAAVLALGGGAALAAGPVCTVPGSYSTIQAAVNDVGCTTINVAAGTYAENVAINHALTLNGPNVGISGNGVRGAEATVSSINITASNVIVNGFSFVNPGVQMNITGATTLSGVSVKNNIFSGYSSVGFPTYNAGNLSVTSNLFKTPLAATEAMQIKADASTPGGCNGTVVSNNVFTAASNNGGSDINFSCTGSGSTGVTVSGNTDTGLADTNGTSFTAFSGVTGGIVVTNNHVTGTPTSGSAIFFFGSVSGSVQIDGNQITGGHGSAVSIHGANDLGTGDTANTGTFTITKNNLSGNARGIYVAPTALGSGAQVIANRNNVSANTAYGIDNETSTTTVVNGTCNWWGMANGPGLVGPGTGSLVSTGVTFAPWLVSSNLNGSCTGGAPVATTKADCRNGGWKTHVRANGSAFEDKDDCIDYVVKHQHKINGDVKYTAYGLNRHAEFDMNTADNKGSFEYSDVNGGSYKVKVSSVKVNGNSGWFAGVVTKASDPSWVGQWLFAKVKDNSPDQIWGSFTNQTTAQNGVTTMAAPADGPFDVTKGHLEVN